MQSLWKIVYSEHTFPTLTTDFLALRNTLNSKGGINISGKRKTPGILPAVLWKEYTVNEELNNTQLYNYIIMCIGIEKILIEKNRKLSQSVI